MTASLDFTMLDGLVFAAQRGRLTNQIPVTFARELGPLVEFYLLAAAGLLPPPEKAEWLRFDGLAVLYDEIGGSRKSWVSPDGRRVGLFCTDDQPPDEKLWTEFRLAAQQAAVCVGFPVRIAQQFAASFSELASNIYEHSGASETGFVAFRAVSHRFEFVVADRGVGVLRSLQGCPEYERIIDHGDALRLALTEGVSRYGANLGHGYGFRPIFVGLANLNGALRFRSGDHALMIDGKNPTLMTSRSAQKAYMPGFFISIVCHVRAQPLS